MPNIKFVQVQPVEHEHGWDGEHVFSVYVKVFFGDTYIFGDNFTDFASAGWRVTYDETFSKTLAPHIFSGILSQEELEQMNTLICDEAFCDSLDQEIENFCDEAFYNFILTGQGKRYPEEGYLATEYSILHNILQEVRNA